MTYSNETFGLGPVRARYTFLTFFRFIFVSVILGMSGWHASAQTTYTWNATGGGVWSTAANWTPTRTTPAANDILQFTDGGAYVVTGVPATQTIGRLSVSGNTNVTIQPLATTTLSINGPTTQDNLAVLAGSVLTLGGTGTFNLTIVTTANQRGNIAGSLRLATGSTFTTSAVATTIVTVASGGDITNNNGTLTATAATLSFAAGGTYNHARNGGGIPVATWNAASNLNVTGIVNTAVTPFTGTYGNLTWNCAGQTATPYGTSGAVTVAGNLTVTAGNFTTGANAFTASGTTNIASGATLTHGSALKSFAGDITNDGTWTGGTNTCSITGNVTSSGTFNGGTGAHAFLGTAKTINGGTISIPNFTMTGTYTNNATALTVSTALAGSGTLTMGTGGGLYFGGATLAANLNCTANTPNEVVYNGTGAQTVKLITYHHLTVNKPLATVASLAAGTTNVNGNITVQSGVLSDAGNTLAGTATTLMNVADGAIYRTTKTANFFPVNITGANINFNTTGGFDYASATTPFNIPNTPTVTYGTLYFTAGGVNAVRNLTSDINVYSLVITGSGVDQNGFAITGNAAGTFTMGANGHLRINHATQNFPDNFVTANVSFDAASRVTYSYNGPQTVSDVPPAYGDLYTLTGGTKTLGGNVNLLGVLNVGISTTLHLGNYMMSIAGGTTSTTLNGMLDATGSTSVLCFNGSVLQQLNLPTNRLVGGYVNHLMIANTANTCNLTSVTQTQNFTIMPSGNFNLNGQTLGVWGSFENNGLLQGTTTAAVLDFNGPAGLQYLALGNTTGSVAFRLRINNIAGVTMTAPGMVGGLELLSGLLNTDATNILTINTAAGGIGTVMGGSGTSFVNGPVARQFSASFSTAGTYIFPVGKSDIKPFALVNPTTTALTTVRAEVFDTHSGGTGAPGFNNLQNRYWQATVTGGAFTAVGAVQLTESGLNTNNAIGQSATQTGAYQLLGGTLGTGTITSENAPAVSLNYFTIGDRLPLIGTVEVGPGSVDGIFSLTQNGGLFQAINTRGLAGNVTAVIIGDIATEDGTHALNPWNEYGGSGYTLTIQSNGPARTVSGTYNGGALASNGLFRINGADRVTISGGTGTDRLLTFRNTNTGNFAATFNFFGAATGNTINNCTVEGAPVNTVNGVIYFGTATGTGNINNTIDNCDIRDLSTATATPNNAIFSLGSSAALANSVTVNNCNIYNYFHASQISCGISLSTSNVSWNITGNRFYQAVTRTNAANDHFVIQVSDAASVGHNIVNNTIGYATAAGTGTYTLTNTAGTARFVGIYLLSVSSGNPVNTVSGNRIEAINFSTNSGGSPNFGIFSGIYLGAGKANINGNTVGSTSGTGNITTLSNTNGGATYGIRVMTTGVNFTVNNNNIGGINASGGSNTNTGIVLHGISFTTASATVDGNTVGSTSTANSMQLTSNATTNAASLQGIVSTAGAAYSQTFSNNTVANLNNTNTGTGSSTGGIITSGGGQFAINGNTVRNLTSSGTSTGTGLGASLLGISMNTGNTTQLGMADNTVYALSSTAAAANVTVTGIYFAGGTSTANAVNRNLVHGLSLASTGATASLLGIHLGGGYINTHNNMVRLGFDGLGNPITGAFAITGILKDGTSTNNVYFNTVYIAGSGVGSAALNTSAFRRSQTGTDVVRNNIFANARSNAGAGGKHYAMFLNAASITCNNNVYHHGGTGGTLASVAGADQTSMQMFRATTGGQNLNSGVATLAQINFVAPDATAPDLRLNNNNCASGAGVAVGGIGSDFYSAARATVPAIGAHETGTFVPLTAAYDVYTPNFSFTNIPTQSSSCVPPVPVTVDVTVTDLGTGTPTSGANVPQMWWRVSTGTYAPAAGTLVSGDGNNGVWRFTVNPTLTAGETYQYYFVAEDQAPSPNRWFSRYEAATPVHPQVYTQTTPPVTPSTFTVSSVSALGGTVVVGGTIQPGETAGENWFASLTRFNDLFYNINTRGLSGNLLVLVRADVTNEDGQQSLNQWAEYCGSGYTLTIRPETPSMKILSGNYLGMGLFGITGADRVTIDGRHNGTGTDRYLRFVNTYSSNGGSENDVIKFGGVGTTRNNLVRNCEIEGQSSKTTGGVVYLASGSDSITLENNIIRGGNAWATNIILADGASNITIKDNEIFNFLSWTANRAYGIRVNAGNGSNWNITGNSIYNTGINGQSPQTAIDFLPGAASNDNRISGNYIGGSSAQCGTGGPITYWGNSYNPSMSEVRILGINVSCGNITLDGNNITNINISGSDYTGFVCMAFGGSTVPTVTGNMFGTGSNGVPNNSKIIQVLGGGLGNGSFPGYIYGIWNQSTSTARATYNDNQFYYLAQLGSWSGGNVHCIAHQSMGPATITGNVMNGPQATGIDYNSYGIRISPTANVADACVIERNVITGPYIIDPTPGATNAAIYINPGSFTVNGTIGRNLVYDMRNVGASTAVYASYSEGIYMLGRGNWDVSNNQLYMNNNGLTNKVGVYGIDDEMGSGSILNFYNNTVYVSGTQLNTGATDYSSYGYFRYPGASGTVVGSTVNLKNNIFINTRNNGGSASTHSGIANIGSSNFATGWAANACNYNFVSTANTATACIWGGSTYTFDNWKNVTSAGYRDANSWYVPAVTAGASSATQLNPTDLFGNLSGYDLTINTANQAAWFVNGKGVAGPLSGNQPVDLQGDVRETTYGLGIDIGADEFTPNPGVLPHALTATPAPGGTNTFTFAGRTFGSITWGSGGTVPSAITARYFSGDAPGIAPSPAFVGLAKADFMVEFVPTGGAGYSYTATLNYDDAQLGDFVSTEPTMQMIKTVSTDWTSVTSTIDPVANLLTSGGPLTAFSYFSGGVPTTDPLPISLLSFEARCETGDVKLIWKTASETNNARFTVHRSADLADWEEVTTVPGAGNSNQTLTYETEDVRPLNGLAYYRLTQTDYDGTSETFTPVSVSCYADGAGNALSVYPNPATDKFTVAVTLASAQNDVTLEIIDLGGKTVLQRNLNNLPAGSSEWSFDRSGLGAGTYIIRLKAGRETIKPIKLIVN